MRWSMRWQRLFADLQAEFDEAAAAAERSEDASRRRVETGAVRLVDRLAGALDRPLTLRCSGVGDVTGVLVEVGADWLLLTDESRRDVLVATSTVQTVAGLGRATAPAEDPGPVRARLDLRRALRGLARDRSVVQVVLDDGAAFVGTVDGVGPTTSSWPSTLPTSRAGQRPCEGCGRSPCRRWRSCGR